MKTLLNVFALIVVNLAVTALIGEAVVRMIYEPGDYLEGGTLEDEVLDFKLEPNSPGHDAWGFRNAEVPERVDILALGDSWTYGLQAVTSETWPSWLRRSTHQTVYNLSVYGHGPTDYLHLLRTRGLTLDPSVIVLGFSYTTDLPETYRNVYTKDHWEYLRTDRGSPRAEKVETEKKRQEKKDREALEKSSRLWPEIRTWLRQKSLLYQVIERGPIGGTVNTISARFKAEDPNRCVMRTELPFETFVDPGMGLKSLNVDSPRISEGLDTSLEILREIAEISASRGIRFVVALFPTKDRIYDGRLVETQRADCVENFDRLMKLEAGVDVRIKSFLEAHDIEYADGLPPLIRASRAGQIFDRSPGIHPNGDGYRILGEAIGEQLSKQPPERSS